MSGEEVRVILWYRVPDEDVRQLTTTYSEIGEQLAGTPGMVSSELLGSQDEPGVIMVTSRWRSQDDLQAWVRSSSHRKTSPLRPYLDKDRSHPYETFAVLSTT
ncbi:antibiotic biosynthesis monooxygenase family protein [Streptosporangium sp. KLBMP 9127]|nr:antibiotic biosynthesis monooxygenase [Streptosporangium sp. KLBMP 9127]